MSQVAEYYKPYSIVNPAYNVVRVAGRHIWDRARQYFGGRMLEIGCGTKAKGLLVGEFVDEHVGLDHEASPHGVAHVDIVASAYDIPQQDGAFDCVLSTSVLEHLEEPELALRESLRVLKPGGYAIYTMPLFWHLHEEPRDFFRYTRYGLRYLFEKAGYQMVELVPLSGFWMTFGSELGYYLNSLGRGPLAYLVKPVIALNNLLVLALDAADRRVNPVTDRWTWMYLVVARKPAA